MAKERLSKLQKWILEKCLKDLGVSYHDVFVGFFSKRDTLKKPEFIGEGHDLKKRYGESYEKELDIEKVERLSVGGYIWKGLKISIKPEFCITNSEKVIVSRSLKGLAKRGFLIQPRKWGEYRLTRAGFLKANESATVALIISFKEYQKKIEKAEQEKGVAFKKSLVGITETLKRLQVSNYKT